MKKIAYVVVSMLIVLCAVRFAFGNEKDITFQTFTVAHEFQHTRESIATLQAEYENLKSYTVSYEELVDRGKIVYNFGTNNTLSELADKIKPNGLFGWLHNMLKTASLSTILNPETKASIEFGNLYAIGKILEGIWNVGYSTVGVGVSAVTDLISVINHLVTV